MEEVKVTNRNTTTFRDAFLGIEYVFEPGKPTVIPVGAAVHIFGFGLEDRSRQFTRAGFYNAEAGQKWFSAFDLEYIEYVRKDDADEIEALKIAMADKQTLIDELTAQLQATTTEIEQLKERKKKG
jgi:hypothetical protein